MSSQDIISGGLFPAARGGSALMSTRLNVSCVSFLNALPYVAGLRTLPEAERPRLILEPPFLCAERLRRGEADLSLVPLIEFARIEGAVLSGAFGIASRREVKSVILLSRAPLRQVRTVAVDANSRTSVALVRILLARVHRNRPEFIPMPPQPDAMLERCDAALLIGDAALTASRSAVDVHDLASMWNEATGLPCVFALWAARNEAAAAEGARLLERALTSGTQALADAAAEAAGRSGLSTGEILDYLTTNIHYRLGAAEWKSVEYFISLCHEEGLLSSLTGLATAGRGGVRGALDP